MTRDETHFLGRHNSFLIKLLSPLYAVKWNSIINLGINLLLVIVAYYLVHVDYIIDYVVINCYEIMSLRLPVSGDVVYIALSMREDDNE